MRTQPYWLQVLPLLRQHVWFILLGIAGCAALLLWLLTMTAASAEPTFAEALQHAPTDGDVSVRNSCPECGVVSSMREIAGANSGIEVTVRMKDGSMRQFADASSSFWRVGERMIIIDNADHAGDGYQAGNAMIQAHD